MLRTCRFIKEYNNVKGSRLILMDFFSADEVTFFQRNYLTSSNRANDIIGSLAYGQIGILDEINDRPTLETFQLINGAVPDEIVQIFNNEDRQRFPETMAEDIVTRECQVDFDRMPAEREQVK